MKKSIIAFIIVIAIAIVVIISVNIGNFEEKEDNENNDITHDGENDQNDVEPVYDVNISILANKTECYSGDKIQIHIKATNNMERSFPFGDYKFRLWYVNKSEYDFNDEYYFNDIEWYGIYSISIPPGGSEINSTTWDTTGIDSGSYYIQFVVQKVNPDSTLKIVDTAMFEIKIL